MNPKGSIQLPPTTITVTDQEGLLKEVVRAALHNITPNGLLNGICAGLLAHRSDRSDTDTTPRQVLTHLQVKQLFSVLINLQTEWVSQDEVVPHDPT